jgi:hypothetical protein
MKEIKESFICSCGHHDHMVIVNIFDWHNDRKIKGPGGLELCFSFHLAPHPFHKRIWNAIKYVLGFRSTYGDFDETLIDLETAKRLQIVFNDYVTNAEQRSAAFVKHVLDE